MAKWLVFAFSLANIVLIVNSTCTETCPENEEYDLCPSTCNPRLCSVDERLIRCAPPPPPSDPSCVPGCQCIEGYKRNDTGICIPKEQCPPICRGLNEVWDSCPTCDPNTCESIGQVYNCPIETADNCKGACRCIPGYYRNTNGECISKEDCSSCGGDPNAKPGCGLHCGNRCSDYNTKVICPRIQCPSGGCECNEGYVYDDNTKKCVLPSQCSWPKTTTTTPIENKSTTQSTPSSTSSSTSPSSNSDALQALSRGINIFAFQFLKQVIATNVGENVIMSPCSVQIPLAQLALLYGEKETEKQLLASLSLSSKDQIRQSFNTFLEGIKGGDGVTFSKANKVYVNDQFPLSEAFITDTQKVFNGSAENINCNDPTGTADAINKWVESQTNNRITDLIQPSNIDDSLRMLLVNAIYFKATWKTQFNKKNTKPADFYTSDNKTVQIPFMNLETKMDYYNSGDLNAQVVRLPYVNSDYSFVIVLPNDKNGFSQTLDKMSADSMATALNNLSSIKVKLSLPSMEFKSTLDKLIDILTAMGISDIFDSKADFQGILQIHEPLSVTSAIQKAYIKVDEEGSEAAAATGFGVGLTSVVEAPPKTPVVICDHPFIFGIYSGNNPIFVGAYQKNQ